jgi:prepilin-type N-terminal cleavage/methylation domain-containing protein
MTRAASHPRPRSMGVSPMPSSRPRGFTLIEVLATLVLLGIVMPVAMRGVSLALAASSTARRTAEAASLAEMKLNELIVDGSWRTGNAGGDFADQNLPDYRWTCENAARDYGTNEVIVHVTWTQRGQERSMSLATLVYPDAYLGGTTTSTGTSTATGGGQ